MAHVALQDFEPHNCGFRVHRPGECWAYLGKLVLVAVLGGGEGERVEAEVAGLARGVREHVRCSELEPVGSKIVSVSVPCVRLGFGIYGCVWRG